MNTYTHVADVRSMLPDIPPDSIISRTIHSDTDVKVVLFGFAADQELSEHTAAHPAILHVIEGDAHLTLGDDAMEATSGTWVYMPPHLRHSIVAKTPLVMLLLLLKTGKHERGDG